ncbi:Subtilisin-like protein protease [Cinnamomum micranthum f. kanehirae]|uniref:Subtilisin-like protein protease n=1 Tax=Cinnamomum micranthum f. kanehirae TaxID=337451 RepID=A0A443PRC4_9MAGN|nr:Subtilisin-like protein protease [Cinnamomum micranthum f. kanehirae]
MMNYDFERNDPCVKKAFELGSVPTSNLQKPYKEEGDGHGCEGYLLYYHSSDDSNNQETKNMVQNGLDHLLSYPSFIAFVNANDSPSFKEFRSTVTNVGNGISTYSAKVTPLEGFTDNVVPKKLVFKEKNEKQSFMLVLKSSSKMKKAVIHGYL